MKFPRTIVAIAIGVVFYILLRYATYALLRQFSAPGPVTIWTVLSSPASMRVTLLPAFLAGWLSHGHGVASGFFVGLVGSGVYSALVGSAASYFGVVHSQIVMSVAWFFAMCVVAGIYGAAAGGSAQLVRSNKSFKRTRGKPRAA